MYIHRLPVSGQNVAQVTLSVIYMNVWILFVSRIGLVPIILVVFLTLTSENIGRGGLKLNSIPIQIEVPTTALMV